MTRESLDIDKMEPQELDWFCAESWCDQCQKADLGISNPVMYIENNRKFVEGECNVCKAICRSEIRKKEIGDNSF